MQGMLSSYLSKKVFAKNHQKNLQFNPKSDIVEDIILEGYLIKYHIIGVSEISGTDIPSERVNF